MAKAKPEPLGLPKAIKAKIILFEKAAKDHAWMGGTHPEDWPLIEERWHEARHALEHTIKRYLTLAAKK